MKDMLVDNPTLNNPKLEKLGIAKLQERAYHKAFEVASAEIDATAEVARALPAIEKRLELLESKDAKINVRATLAQPQVAKQVEKADTLKAFVGATMVEFCRRNNVDRVKVFEQLPDGRTKALTKHMLKAASGTATTTDAGWGAELVTSGIADWLPALARQSVFGALAQMGRLLPFGDNASLTVPQRGANAQGSLKPAFIAENATIPVKADVIGSTHFDKFKLGVISTFSNELAKVSVPFIADVIEQSILEDMSVGIDDVLLDPLVSYAPGLHPASPWFMAPNQASSGTDLDSVLADIAWLIGTISAVQPRKPVLIIDPMRLMRLRMIQSQGQFVFRAEIETSNTLMGIPLIVSPNVPPTTVYIIDADDFAYWFETPIIDMAASATIVMADDDGAAPTMADTGAVTVAGSLKVSDAADTTPPAPVKSMFQTYATAMRTVYPITWGNLRSTASAAYLTGVQW